APTAFQVLPNPHLAGNVVGRALGRLHWIAIVSEIIFLASSLLYSRLANGTAHAFAMRHVLICLMLGLTLLSQFWIIPRMDTLRASVADFATVPLDNPARAQFDALHVWSTRVEGTVLLFFFFFFVLLADSSFGPVTYLQLPSRSYCECRHSFPQCRLRAPRTSRI